MFTGVRIALHQRRALNCFVSSEFEKAAHHFRKIQSLNPNAQGISHNLALTEMALGNYSVAEKLFLDDIRRYGDYYPRLKAIADLYYIWGKGAEAKSWYSKVLDAEVPEGSVAFLKERLKILNDPDRLKAAQESHTLYIEGTKFEAQMDVERAIEAYQKSSELDPTNLPALNNLGAMLMNHKKDYAGAAKLFKQALTLDSLDWIRSNLKRAQKALSQ